MYESGGKKKEKRKQLECFKCTNGNSSLLVLNINLISFL